MGSQSCSPQTGYILRGEFSPGQGVAVFFLQRFHFGGNGVAAGRIVLDRLQQLLRAQAGGRGGGYLRMFLGHGSEYAFSGPAPLYQGGHLLRCPVGACDGPGDVHHPEFLHSCQETFQVPRQEDHGVFGHFRYHSASSSASRS